MTRSGIMTGSYCAERIFMRGKAPAERETPFAQWLYEGRSKRSLTMVALADRAGISHARIAQLEKGGKPKRDMVERLAAALTQDEADDHTPHAVLSAGLRAAGFTDLSSDSDPLDTLVDRAGYDNEMLGEEDREQLARSVNALIVGIVEQAKRDRHKS